MFFMKRKKEDETSLFAIQEASNEGFVSDNSIDNSIETNIIDLNIERIQTSKKLSILPNALVALSVFCASVSGGLCEGFTHMVKENLITKKGNQLEALNKAQTDWFYYTFMFGWITGSVPLGCLNFIGRKKSFLLGMCLRVIGWIVLTFSASYQTLICGRFLMGVGVGMVYVLLCLYVTEVSHASVRGTVGTAIPVGLQVGLLITYIAGYYLEWRDLAEMSFVITLVCVAPIILLPESPVWLTIKGRHEQAKSAISFLRGKSYNVTPELINIANSASAEISLFPLCNEHSNGGKRQLKPLAVLSSLIIVERLCGRSAILSFAVSFFERIGSPISSSSCYILISVLQLCGAGISGFIIDCIGRRLLTLLSLTVMGSTLLLMVIFLQIRNLKATEWDLETGWVPLVILLVYVLFYSLGVGMSIYIVTGELIPITSSDFYATWISILYGATSFLTPTSHFALIKTITLDGCCVLYGITCLWCALYVAGCQTETSKLNIEELNLLSEGCLQMDKLGDD